MAVCGSQPSYSGAGSGSISLVDLQLKNPVRQDSVQEKIFCNCTRNGQYISQQETMRPEKRNVQDQDFSRQKIHTVYETGKWMENGNRNLCSSLAYRGGAETGRRISGVSSFDKKSGKNEPSGH